MWREGQLVGIKGYRPLAATMLVDELFEFTEYHFLPRLPFVGIAILLSSVYVLNILYNGSEQMARQLLPEGFAACYVPQQICHSDSLVPV